MRRSTLFLIAIAAFVLGVATPNGYAQEVDMPEVDFTVFIEINATDGDAGLQGKLDGDAWNLATVMRPDGATIFEFTPQNNLMDHGVTELQWESNEPPFTELPLADFLGRFPAGEYTAQIVTIEGEPLMDTSELTHNLPAGPVITAPEADAVVASGEDLTIMWEPVVDDIQRPGAGDLGSAIVSYLVVVEHESEDADEELAFLISADETQAVVPGSFLKPDRIYKIEVGAREESGNQTFTEHDVCTGVCPEEEE